MFIKEKVKKAVSLIYFTFLKEIIERDTKLKAHKNIIFGKNCVIDPTAILICGKNGVIEFEGGNYIGRNVEISANNSKISLGSNTSIQDRCIIVGDVEIGRYCLFSLNVLASSGRHYYELKPEYYIKDQDLLVDNDVELSKAHSRKIIIEDDCWLGINVAVMPGVKIGKGSVIGSNSVITKSVEPYSIMAGSPAKLIKKRLIFELKDSLHYLVDADLPYFYSGFYTNVESIKKDRKNGGIRAMGLFVVYLKHEGNNNIILRIKKNIEGLVKIKYNNQIKEFNEVVFTDVSFMIENNPFHKFQLVTDSNNMIDENQNFIIVQSIKTT
jgi:acetyltransferase-like isoleucine patch superfamily enzyme